MKRTDPECLVAELVRANTAALEAVVAQVVDLIAVTNQLLRQAAPPPETTPETTAAATRKVSVSPELLAEMSGGRAPARHGVPPGVRQQRPK